MSGGIASNPGTLAHGGDAVAGFALDHPGQRRWLLALLFCLALLALLVACVTWLFWWGVGVWGNNIPVTWALDIISYDWWIGIASGGLVVSAALLLSGNTWRGALNRLAEAASLFAACAAGIYPIIHLGRPWFFYWNVPHPNVLGLWPQFRSPLVWDAMAIIGYLGIAFCLWTLGMLPDLALLRDRAQNIWRARFYGIAALGWRGAAAHWRLWQQARRMLAGFGIVLVLALQSGAAVMFAGTGEPGWHDTLMPVFFLVSAIYSGIAMIALLGVAVRAGFGLSALIGPRQLELLGWLMLAAGLATTYCYMIEFFNTGYGGDKYDLSVMGRRALGIYGWNFWLIVAGALLPFHLLWVPALRRSGLALVLVALPTLMGLWMDHWMVIVITLHRDFLPSSEHLFVVSLWGVGTFAGTAGLFGTLLLLFLRWLPVASVPQLHTVPTPESAAHG